MSKLPFYFAFVFLLACVAIAQDTIPPSISAVHKDVDLRVSGLRSLRAESSDAADVLATAVATILNDKELCCDRNSGLEDRLPQSDPVSLKEVSAKLQGRQLLSDGRPVQIKADYVMPSDLQAGQLILDLLRQQAALFQWKSQVYVLYGAVYDEILYTDHTRRFEVHKFLLLDPRYSDSRRQVEFALPGDDLSKAQGMLFLSVTR